MKSKIIGKVPAYLELKELLFGVGDCGMSCSYCRYANRGQRKKEFENLTGNSCGASIIHTFIQMIAKNRK